MSPEKGLKVAQAKREKAKKLVDPEQGVCLGEVLWLKSIFVSVGWLAVSWMTLVLWVHVIDTKGAGQFVPSFLAIDLEDTFTSGGLAVITMILAIFAVFSLTSLIFAVCGRDFGPVNSEQVTEIHNLVENHHILRPMIKSIGDLGRKPIIREYNRIKQSIEYLKEAEDIEKAIRVREEKWKEAVDVSKKPNIHQPA